MTSLKAKTYQCSRLMVSPQQPSTSHSAVQTASRDLRKNSSQMTKKISKWLMGKKRLMSRLKCALLRNLSRPKSKKLKTKIKSGCLKSTSLMADRYDRSTTCRMLSLEEDSKCHLKPPHVTKSINYSVRVLQTQVLQNILPTILKLTLHSITSTLEKNELTKALCASKSSVNSKTTYVCSKSNSSITQYTINCLNRLQKLSQTKSLCKWRN